MNGTHWKHLKSNAPLPKKGAYNRTKQANEQLMYHITNSGNIQNTRPSLKYELYCLIYLKYYHPHCRFQYLYKDETLEDITPEEIGSNDLLAINDIFEIDRFLSAQESLLKTLWST